MKRAAFQKGARGFSRAIAARLPAFAPEALRRVHRSSRALFASEGGKASRSFGTRASRSFGTSAAIAIGLTATVLLMLRVWPHQPLQQRFALSTGVWSADGELLRVTRAADDQYRLWVPLSQVSPDLVDAFLLKEDRSFYVNPSVNPLALTRAAFKTYRGGDR